MIALRDFASGLSAVSRAAVCHVRSALRPHRQGPRRSNLQDLASAKQQNTQRTIKWEELLLIIDRHLGEKLIGGGHCFCRVGYFGRLAFRLVGTASRLIPKHSDGETRYLFLKKHAGHGMTNTMAASALFKPCMLLYTRH